MAGRESNHKDDYDNDNDNDYDYNDDDDNYYDNDYDEEDEDECGENYGFWWEDLACGGFSVSASKLFR